MTTEPGSSTSGSRLPDPETVVAKEQAKTASPTQRAINDAKLSLSRNRDTAVPAAISAGALGLGALAVAAATFGAVRAKREGRTDRKDGRRKAERRDDAPRRTDRSYNSDMEVAGRTVLINKPRQELYAYWRDFQNLPNFMENLREVRPKGDKTNVWVIKAPAGKTVEVETEVTADKPGQLIAWKSTAKSPIDTEGRVEFKDAPGGRGTYVTLVIAYDPPAGKLGKWAAKLTRREPEVQARVELKRFKMLMETGEIATSDNRRNAA